MSILFQKDKVMWLVWVRLSVVVTGMILYFLYTIVYCFWFIYLLDAMKRKRSFYKTMVKCIQGESDLHQQMLAYNARTEFVKFVSVFSLNLVEWVGVNFTAATGFLKFVSDYIYQLELPTVHFLPVIIIDNLNTIIVISVSFQVLFVIFSSAITGSLCMYLSARYAQKSWIQSDGIPYWICFLFSSIALQILVTICYT